VNTGIRIATFNIKDLFTPQPEHEAIFARKLVFLVEAIVRSEASVVALQEVGDDTAFARLCALLPSDFAALPGTADERGIRCAILSKLPVIASKVHLSDQLPFPVFVAGDSAPFAGRLPLRRGIVQADVRVPVLGTVSILTHHMKSNLPRRLKRVDGADAPILSGLERGEAIVRSSVMRAAEALFLRQIVDTLETETPYVCVLGDFNDDRKSAALRILAGDREAKRPLWQMIDRVPEHKRWSTLHQGRPSHIDHILVTPDLANYVTSGDIQNDQLVDHGPILPGTLPPPTDDSDHALFWIELGVQ
jgi:endonuclease/exonuclease/phosphatase family metal-dependent hydrolase